MATESTTPDVTEHQLLENEAAKARSAILRTLDALRADVQAGLDPRAITAKHPIVALAASAAAGFAAASVVVPAKGDHVAERLSRFQSFLKSHLPSDGHASRANHDAHNGSDTTQRENKREENSSLLITVVKEGFKLARPAILSALAAAVTAKVTPPSQPASEPVQPDDRTF